MSQDKIIEIKGDKYRVSRKILSNYDAEIKKRLDELKIHYELWEVVRAIEDKEEIECECPVIPIDKEIYSKLKKICEITGISMKTIATDEFTTLLFDHIAENPIVFLDMYLGIKNIRDPISIVRKLKPVVDISEKYMEEIENTDPMFWINRYNSFKYK